jgi:hypothetical protein
LDSENCKQPAQGELRGKVLTHIQGEKHIGKYQGWIGKKIGEITSVRESFVKLLEEGKFSDTFPVLGKDGKYTVVNTKVWLQGEKETIAQSIAFQQRWELFQAVFDETISSAASVARPLTKLNNRNFSTESARKDVEADLKTISERALKNFKDGLAKLEAMNPGPFRVALMPF